MKTFNLLPLLLLILSFNGFSQITMLEKNNKWASESCCAFQGEFEPEIYCEFQYNSIGQTDTINNTFYQEICRGLNSNYPTNTKLREDNLKVYFLNDENEEKLYYDFTLLPGDTFFIYNSFETNILPEYFIVSDTSTTNIFNQNRKVIYFESSSSVFDNFYWIEGVGSTHGLLYRDIWYYDCNQILTCFADSAGSYNAPNSPSCDLTTSIPKLNQASFSLSPNPASNSLTIQINHIQTNEELLVIRDITGKIVLQRSLNRDNNHIAVSHLKNGLYLIEIGRQVEKFIKN